MFKLTPVTIFTIALILVLIGYSVFMSVKRNSVFKQLEHLLATNDFDAFFELIDKPLTRYLYPSYNLAYFKLNAYMIKGDFAAALDELEALLVMRISKKQRRDLVIKAFNIYIGQAMGDEAKAMLDEIDSWDGDDNLDATRKNCHQIYEIGILGKTDFIDDMESALKTATGAERGRLEYLLSLQYQTKGDTKRAEEYLAQAMNDSFGG